MSSTFLRLLLNSCCSRPPPGTDSAGEPVGRAAAGGPVPAGVAERQAQGDSCLSCPERTPLSLLRCPGLPAPRWPRTKCSPGSVLTRCVRDLKLITKVSESLPRRPGALSRSRACSAVLFARFRWLWGLPIHLCGELGHMVCVTEVSRKLVPSTIHFLLTLLRPCFCPSCTSLYALSSSAVLLDIKCPCTGSGL